jgi:hypothetical protein
MTKSAQYQAINSHVEKQPQFLSYTSNPAVKVSQVNDINESNVKNCLNSCSQMNPKIIRKVSNPQEECFENYAIPSLSNI